MKIRSTRRKECFLLRADYWKSNKSWLHYNVGKCQHLLIDDKPIIRNNDFPLDTAFFRFAFRRIYWEEGRVLCQVCFLIEIYSNANVINDVSFHEIWKSYILDFTWMPFFQSLVIYPLEVEQISMQLGTVVLSATYLPIKRKLDWPASLDLISLSLIFLGLLGSHEDRRGMNLPDCVYFCVCSQLEIHWK